MYYDVYRGVASTPSLLATLSFIHRYITIISSQLTMTNGILKQVKDSAALAAFAQSGSRSFGEAASEIGNVMKHSSSTVGFTTTPSAGSSSRRGKLSRRASFEDLLKAKRQELEEEQQQKEGKLTLEQAFAAKNVARKLRSRRASVDRDRDQLSQSASAAMMMGDDLRYSSLRDDPEAALKEPLLEYEKAPSARFTESSVSSYGSRSEGTDDDDDDDEEVSSLGSEELVANSMVCCV